MKKIVKTFIDYFLIKYYSLKPIGSIREDIRGENLFFITGYDKSGTTWMKYTINEIEKFSCVGSNQYFDFYSELPENSILKAIQAAKERESVFNISANHFKSYFASVYLDRIIGVSNKKSLNFGEKSTEQNLSLIHFFFPKAKVIFMIRDMRDIIVSFAFHFDIKYKNKTKNWSQERSKLNADGSIKDDFIEQEIQKIKAYYRHIINYFKHNSNLIHLVKYEDLIAENGFDHFYKMLQFINSRDVNEHKAKKAWENNTFEKLSKGRKPGEKDEASFFRSGTSKDYVNHLTEKQITLIETELEEQLQYFNYL
jgi:hypothetical protein